MSLVVEDGSGLSTANSYSSVADADSYVADHGADTVWSAASDDDKETALILGTQFIDLLYATRFKGVKENNENALCFPRMGCTDEDGYDIYSDVVPNKIVYAAIEAAVRSINGDDFLAMQSNPGLIKSETKKIAVLEKSIEYVHGKDQEPYYPRIEALVRPFLKGSDRIMRA